uniref:Uncharacterized protein n=1 Tax=Ananas comosus var. bracteatus TaxID=296719 RepID=A0A6V7QMC0_ANACO|nr:unnamed protein product [Ananas comosus var. bracteatus]
MRPPNLAALGLTLVPVQEPVYRYKGETGRACDFAVLDVAPVLVAVEVTRSRRRSIGFRRDLVRWIRDFERNPRSPYLRILVKVISDCWVPSELTVDPYRLFGVRLCRGHVTCWLLDQFRVGFLTLAFQSLFELDRDTLHTRLGSAHECHSGVRLVLSHWCRSCQLDLLSTDQLEWIELDSRNGAGTGVFTVSGTGMLTVPIWIGSDLTFPTVDYCYLCFAEPQVPAAVSSADQDRGKSVAS